MQRWKSHKEVGAGKITGISDEAAKLMIEGIGPVEVDQDYISKHKPYVGGYYVLYEDGYESFSPAEAFENGYTKITREN